MKTILLSLILAVAAAAQTKITVTQQLDWPVVVAPKILVLTAAGLQLVPLDPSIEIVGGILRVKPSALPPAARITHERLALVNGVWTIPTGCTLIMLIRNLPQVAGLDYKLDGATIQWLFPARDDDAVSALCSR